MGIIIKEEFELILNMDTDKKQLDEGTFEEIRRIRMTLKGRETKPLEYACSEIVRRSKQKGYEIKGPRRIPTNTLRVTVRKSPCGEGTNTWDRYEMTIHKTVIDIFCPSSVVKDITTFKIDPSVEVQLFVFKQ